MNEQSSALTEDYTPDSVEACEKVLRTLLSAVDARWQERMVLVGGLAPFYLYEEVPDGIDEHIGSTDVDIGISLTVTEEEGYTSLERRITDLDFEQSTYRWQWIREVDGQRVELEFLCPVGPDDTVGHRTSEPLGGSGNLYGLAVRGIELVPEDTRDVRIEGDTLDDRGRTTAELSVAGLLPLLMLKGFAHEGRTNEKDAYDVVWLLQAHPEGPSGAARQAVRSPIAEQPEVEEALGILRGTYDTYESEGPSWYARFEIDRRGIEGSDDNRDRLRRDAYQVVQRFCETWDEEVA